MLMGMLAISQERAAALLQEAGGEVETAVALHFSAGPAPAAAESPRAKLRSILGHQSCSQQQATALLRRAGGSVEAAVDMFFIQQEEAGPGPSTRVQRAQSQPISIRWGSFTITLTDKSRSQLHSPSNEVACTTTHPTKHVHLL